MKKSILILPSIILLCLVNACTPLPTGGPVSANRIYNVYNKNYPLTNSSFDTTTPGLYYIDLNNDNDFDIRVNSTGLDVELTSINGVEFGSLTDSLMDIKIKSYSLNEPINNSSEFDRSDFVPLKGAPFGAVPFYSPDFTNINYPIFTSTHYVAFRYQNGGDYHYGWINIAIIFKTLVAYDVKIIESSFNNIPNQPILAGKK